MICAPVQGNAVLLSLVENRKVLVLGLYELAEMAAQRRSTAEYKDGGISLTPITFQLQNGLRFSKIRQCNAAPKPDLRDGLGNGLLLRANCPPMVSAR